MTQVLEAPRTQRRQVRSHPAVPERARPSEARAAAAAVVLGAAAPRPASVAAPRPASVGAPRPETEERRERRHLYVVDRSPVTPERRRRRSRILMLVGAGSLAVIALALVYLHVLLAQRQYSIDNLSTEVQTQRANYDKLRLQVAQLGSPQHIISVAVGQLKMQQPASVTYLTPTMRVGKPVTNNAPSTSSSAASTSGHKPVTLTPPAGDADWPQIKPQLAGNP